MRIFDWIARLQGRHARVHPPRSAAGGHGHGEIRARPDAVPEDVGRDLGQLHSVAGDDDLHTAILLRTAGLSAGEMTRALTHQGTLIYCSPWRRRRTRISSARPRCF